MEKQETQACSQIARPDNLPAEESRRSRKSRKRKTRSDPYRKPRKTDAQIADRLTRANSLKRKQSNIKTADRLTSVLVHLTGGRTGLAGEALICLDEVYTAEEHGT
jgi:hypothetical protein